MYPSLSNQRVLYILAVLYSFRMNILLSVFFPALAYLSGSLPFSIWVTRYVKGVDVRDAGSGHATTTNTIRQAGFGWGRWF